MKKVHEINIENALRICLDDEQGLFADILEFDKDFEVVLIRAKSRFLIGKIPKSDGQISLEEIKDCVIKAFKEISLFLVHSQV